MVVACLAAAGSRRLASMSCRTRRAASGCQRLDESLSRPDVDDPGADMWASVNDKRGMNGAADAEAWGGHGRDLQRLLGARRVHAAEMA